MGFFSNLFGRKQKKESRIEFSQSDIDVIADSAQRLADVINESLKIAKETNNIDTKSSRLFLAKEKLKEVKEISNKYAFIKLGFLNDVEKEIEDLESDLSELVAKINQSISEYKSYGEVEGRHYTNYVESVKQLKRENKYAEARKILLSLIDATENEANNSAFGVAPWYYEQLAIIYRKEKNYSSEVEVLERFQKQKKSPGSKPKKLDERLVKAKLLLAKQRA